MAETSKYTLMLINFITLLAGISVSALGIYSLGVGKEVSNLVSLGMPSMVLIAGISVVLVSGLGLYAAYSENPSLLKFFFASMMILLFFQVILSSLALARQADVDMQIHDAWGRAAYHDQRMIEKLEKTLGCCGYASVHDRAVPHDCVEDAEFGFVEPCRDKLGGPVKSTLQTLGYVGLILAALQGFALLMTLTLMGDVMGPAGHGYREASRLHEARSLLREGEIPAQQYPHLASPHGSSLGGGA